MIKPDAAPQIPLNEPLAKILRLHGEPFVDLLEGTSFQPGEPTVRVSEGLQVPPHIHDMVSRIIDLQQIYSPSNHYTVHDQQSKDIEDGFRKIVTEEALTLGDEEFEIFDKHLATEILRTLSLGLKSLPTFDDVMLASDKPKVLSTIHESVQRQLHICHFLQIFSSVTNGRGEVGRIMAENFYHDAFDYYLPLRDAPDYLQSRPEKLEDSRHQASLQHDLTTNRNFVIQIIDGNLAIASGNFSATPFDPTVELGLPLNINANRFKLSLTMDGRVSRRGEKGQITYHNELEGPCYGNSPSLALVLYNLVKNPLKRAYMLNKPLPAVDVWIGPSSDGNCSSIFIRDEGLGFSFDELRAKFTKEAFDKFEAGTSLSFIEECLIDEALQEHIPFKTYADLVCNRGATTGGGTGIGLSVAKEIIETGHQGMLRLYNHPRKGAGAQILLPNVDSSVSEEQRKEIARASLRHQLQHGLKE